MRIKVGGAGEGGRPVGLPMVCHTFDCSTPTQSRSLHLSVSAPWTVKSSPLFVPVVKITRDIFRSGLFHFLKFFLHLFFFCLIKTVERLVVYQRGFDFFDLPELQLVGGGFPRCLSQCRVQYGRMPYPNPSSRAHTNGQQPCCSKSYAPAPYYIPIYRAVSHSIPSRRTSYSSPSYGCPSYAAPSNVAPTYAGAAPPCAAPSYPATSYATPPYSVVPHPVQNYGAVLHSVSAYGQDPYSVQPFGAMSYSAQASRDIPLCSVMPQNSPDNHASISPVPCCAEAARTPPRRFT